MRQKRDYFHCIFSMRNSLKERYIILDGSNIRKPKNASHTFCKGLKWEVNCRNMGWWQKNGTNLHWKRWDSPFLNVVFPIPTSRCQVDNVFGLKPRGPIAGRTSISWQFFCCDALRVAASWPLHSLSLSISISLFRDNYLLLQRGKNH